MPTAGRNAGEAVVYGRFWTAIRPRLFRASDRLEQAVGPALQNVGVGEALRIAFVTSEYVTEPSFGGGLANYLGRVTQALAQRGHDVHVFVRSSTDEQLDYQGVTVHRVVPIYDRRMIFDHIDPFVPRALYNTYQDMKAAWCLWRRWLHLSRSQHFDLVQVSNVQCVGLFFRFVRNTPVVTRWSSYRPLWDTLAGVTPRLDVRTRWKLERLCAESARYHYAPSCYLARQIEAKLHLPKVSVVETPFFDKESSLDFSAYDQHSSGKNYLLFFGRMTQMKGVHLLGDALPSVLQSCPDMQVLLIGRDGFAPNGQSMIRYIKDRSAAFADRVLFLDEMRHEQLYPIIQGARLVVIPSLVDNLPNTCLEAMGLGKTVIATSGSCFEQLIASGHSGLLVPPGNVERLAETIIDAWKLRNERLEQIGRRAKERIAKLHPDVTISELVTYYQNVVREHAARNLAR